MTNISAAGCHINIKTGNNWTGIIIDKDKAEQIGNIQIL
jgi:hypothetical protein